MADAKSAVVADFPWQEAIVGPSFSSGQPDFVTASVGKVAYLPCRVRQLGDRKVSRYAAIIQQAELCEFTAQSRHRSRWLLGNSRTAAHFLEITQQTKQVVVFSCRLVLKDKRGFTYSNSYR